MDILERILKKARSMAPLSQSATRLMEIVGDERHGFQEITRIVEADSALTTQVLRVVNSPMFGARESISTVSRALHYLGEKMLVSIAVDTCAPQLHQPLTGYESGQGDLWAHCLKTAIAARELTELGAFEIRPNLAFTAGIVHDIGKSVLSQFLFEKLPSIIESVDHGDALDYLDAEKKAVGTDHCIVGGELARHWGLPVDLEMVIRHHHWPADAVEDYRPVVYAVHLGDMLSMMSGTSTGTDAMTYRLDEGYAQYFPLERRDLEELMMRVLIEFEDTQNKLFGGQQN
jgi:putative nucleotidyltransferase with HDIG domain